jgi:hypothetical protein
MVTVMAQHVLTVQKTQLVITDGNRTPATAYTPTGLTDITHAVPFVTTHVTGAESNGNQVSNYQVDAYFSGGDLIVERDATSGEVTVEVTIVEFDSARVRVQSGTWSLPSSGSPAQFEGTETLGTTLGDVNAAYLVHYMYQSAAGGPWSKHLVHGRITNTTTLTFDRCNGAATADGHYYVIESLSGSDDFSVQHFDFSVDPASGTATAPTDFTALADPAKTMLICSYTAGETVSRPSLNDRTDEATAYVRITDASTITAERKGSGFELTIGCQLVEFSGLEEVTRGLTTQSSALYQDTESVSVTAANSMAIISGNLGATVGGSFPGATSSDNIEDAFVALTLTDTVLTLTHATSPGPPNEGDGAADNDIAWEVVQWDLGSTGPTRRVLVR